jgi:hypothetical protein
VRGVLLLAGVVLASACAQHHAAAAFRRSVFIGDRGISVPLPPPSFVDASEQDVDVEGEVVGDDPVLAGTLVHVEDLHGDGVGEVELAAGATSFTIEGVGIDLTANCLELWLVAPDGREGDRVLVHAEIVGPQEIETVLGCE